MMRRLREIPCRMLARTAVQPRVLVALIQYATVATDVVAVATESEEDVIINCVAIFRCMTFADCRLQTADRGLQTADRRPQTADCMRQQDCKFNETKNIVIN